jgi:hypothetical protein
MTCAPGSTNSHLEMLANQPSSLTATIDYSTTLLVAATTATVDADIL